MNLELREITYSYKEGNQENVILEHVNFTFKEGTFYTIMGPSGAGKTTLLSLASGMTTPQDGTVYFDGKDIYNEIGIINFRRKYTSIIFQAYNLIPHMNVFQNIEVALGIKKKKVKDQKTYIEEKLNSVGISDSFIKRNVKRLSGGQQQRVAVARALSVDSPLIFADEPTGNLDNETSKGIIDIMKDLAHNDDKVVIMVTHDAEIAKQADVSLVLKDKQLKYSM